MAMMEFEEFKAAIADNIRELLPEELTGITVDLHTMTKNNDTKYASLKVTHKEANIVQQINLEDCFRQYRSGTSLDRILQGLAEVCAQKEMPNHFDAEQVTDLEQHRDKIRPQLINASMNRKLLEQCPHILIEDLAVVFYMDLSSSGDERLTIPVHNSLAANWGMDAETLYSLAVKNLESGGSVFMPITDVLAELLSSENMADFCKSHEDTKITPKEGSPLKTDIFVLTNHDRFCGAAMILVPNVMKTVVRRIGEGFYAIPSSIHEFLVIPASTDMTVPELNAMIQNVNITAVIPEERLSCHAYRYFSETGLRSVLY